MRTIAALPLAAILITTLALSGEAPSDKEDIKIFWQELNNGARAAIVSDKTDAYTDQEVQLSLVIHNPTEKAIRVSRLDKFQVRCHDGIGFDQVKGGFFGEVIWQKLDAGATLIYSVHRTWEKPGTYGTYFATDRALRHDRDLVFTTAKHTITVLKRDG